MNKLTTLGLTGAVSICASLTAMPVFAAEPTTCVATDNGDYTYTISGCTNEDFIIANIQKQGTSNWETYNDVYENDVVDEDGNGTIDLKSVIGALGNGTYTLTLDSDEKGGDSILTTTIDKELKVNETSDKFVYEVRNVLNGITAFEDDGSVDMTEIQIPATLDADGNGKLDITSYFNGKDAGTYEIAFLDDDGTEVARYSVEVEELVPAVTESDEDYIFNAENMKDGSVIYYIDENNYMNELEKGTDYELDLDADGNGTIDMTKFFEGKEAGDYQISFNLADDSDEVALITVTVPEEVVDPVTPVTPAAGETEKKEEEKVTTPDTGVMAAFENGSAAASSEFAMLMTAAALAGAVFATKKAFRK